MTARRDAIESLRQELERLELFCVNIRQAINNLETETTDIRISVQLVAAIRPTQQLSHTRHLVNGQCNMSVVRDRDGVQVKVGDRVNFFTRGRYRSTRGTVSRFLKTTKGSSLTTTTVLKF